MAKLNQEILLASENAPSVPHQARIWFLPEGMSPEIIIYIYSVSFKLSRKNLPKITNNPDFHQYNKHRGMWSWVMSDQ